MNPCFFSRISVNSSQFVATCVFASRCAFAFAYISSCICASNASQVSDSLSNGTMVFSLVSRRTTTACPASISFGPTSTRSGIPFTSCSANLNPGLLSESSTFTRKLDASTLRSSSAFSSTPSFFCMIGTIMICVGATFGGSTSPLSSPCTMMIAPIILVVIPQDV